MIIIRKFKIVSFFCILCLIIGAVCCVMFTTIKNNVSYVYNKKNKDLKIIGIIPYYAIDGKTEEEQKFNNFNKLRDRYVDSFKKVCKNIAFIILPVQGDRDEKTLSIVDGIIISGGIDIDAKYFNQKLSDKVKDVEPERRTNFTIQAVEHAMKNNKPLLGVCNGMQILNIVNGGDVIQDIPSEVPNSEIHRGESVFKTHHDVKINKKTWLYNVLKKNKINVNSNHHQAIGKIGKNLRVSAVANDGIVEAIECVNCKKPIIGIQWHPEFLMTKNDEKIVKAFCDSVEEDI